MKTMNAKQKRTFHIQEKCLSYPYNMWNKTHAACSENTRLERKLTFKYKNHRTVWVERMPQSKKNLSHDILR